MSAVPKQLLTPEEYLAKERVADFKSEYYQGEMFAMPGAGYEHGQVRDNLTGEIRERLKGSDCQSVSGDLRVKIPATGLYTYPDINIVCGQPEFEDDVFDTLLNPRVLFEVLSERTERYDRGTKFAHYRQIPSLQEYVLAAQDRGLVERYTRRPDNCWNLTVCDDLSATFELTSVPVRIPMSEIYRNVEFKNNPLR